MKLWQKVFLCTLLLTMISTYVTSLVLVRNSQKMMFSLEVTHCTQTHENLAAGIANRVIYERLRQNKVLLNREETIRLAQANLAQANTAAFQTFLESDDHRGLPIDPIFKNMTLEDDFLQEGSCSLVPMTVENRQYMLAGSLLRLEGKTYQLYSLTDISEMYGLRERQLLFIRRISLLFSCSAAVVLLLIVVPILAPLRKLTAATKKIAAGDYAVRVEEAGSVELRELARSMNTMAGAVEANVAELEQVADNRKRFIANLAHEMKTPLTSILGFADLLRISRTVSDGQRQEYAGIIVEEARRLRSLSGKLMELITMGSTALTLTETDVPTLFSEMELVERPLMQSHSLQFYVQAAPVSIVCDVPLVKSMLYNLLDNAVKASPKESRIVLFCTPDEKTQTVRFSVRDFGIGMSAEAVSKATQPFYMEDKSRSRKAGGAGLGLALCAEIARLHSGSLSIDSVPGKGTTVHVVLPVKAPAAKGDTHA